MPSGKKSKQQRRAVKAAPPAPQTRRQASPRVLIGVGVVVAATAIGIVLAVVLGGGSSSSLKDVPAVGSIANGLTGSAEVDALFKGIPQNGLTLGSASAPATMVEYVDLQCPYCQQFETLTLPSIVKQYVRTGKLEIVLRPWAFIGPDSVRGQAAVLAAAARSRAFNYLSILYDNQGVENTGWLSDAMVAAAAASIPGLQVHTLLSDRKTSAVADQAKTVDAQAKADGVTSTPSLLVGKTGKHGTVVKLRGPSDAASLKKAINAALA